MNDSSGFIHRFIPGGEDHSVPMLLLLHGTGGNEDDLLDLGRALHPDAPLLSPRGKILEHGMPRFFRRLAEGVFDEEDLVHRTHELADFIQKAAEQYRFTDRKVIAVGYSNGANIAASMLLLRPGILGGAVLLRAMVPLVPPKLPDLEGVPVFLANGRHDPLIPPANAERLASMLRQAGATVAQHWSEGGHQLDSIEFEEAKHWLAANFGVSKNQ
jgi:predicted esterase